MSLFDFFNKPKKSELVGKRIYLEHMSDEDPIPCGETGTIVNVNPFGDYEVEWDCGRKLSVIPSEDTFRILD